MDSVFPTLISVYSFTLLIGGIVALVFQFVADARSGKDNPLEPWRLKWSDALLLCWGFIVAMLALSFAIGHISALLNNPNHQIILEVVGFQGGLLLLLLALIRFYPQLFTLALSPQRLSSGKSLSQAIVQLLAAGILFLGVSLYWQGILFILKTLGIGDYSEKQELVNLLSEGLSLPFGTLAALLIAAVVIAPIAEELLFRGLFYRFLKSRIRPHFAMVISSVCFGAIHYNMVAFIPLTFLGMVLVRAYERTGSLKVPILMHALFNANMTLLALLSPYLEEVSQKLATVKQLAQICAR